MAITIKDIAQMANTSTATVSRVLSQKPGVAEDKRQRILELAERLDYNPNLIAKNLALQKSHVLGFVAANLSNPVYVEFLHIFQTRVEPLGYRILVADSEQDVAKEKRNILTMREHRAEGLIVFPVHDWNETSDIDHFLQLKLQRFPFVIVGKIDGYGFDYVTSEEVETARHHVKHLLKLGHRRIGFVGVCDTNRCIRERREGVARALSEEGLKLEDKYTIPFGPGWQEALVKMMKRPDAPTGLVMVNDVYGLQALRPLANAGLRVPQDVSLICFGDGPWSDHLMPSLTTTDENVEKVASVAIETLLNRLDDPALPPVQHLVPQEFLDRESCTTFKA